MKKLIVFLTLALAISLTSFSQGSLREFNTLTADSLGTVAGIQDALTVYSTFLGPYWDYSIQFKSTPYNSGTATDGDSSRFAVAAYRTNDINASVWEEIISERDTLEIKGSGGITVELTDFTGAWLKFVLTGYISHDTVLIVPYEVKKLKVTID